jgi:hypothetical protein
MTRPGKYPLEVLSELSVGAEYDHASFGEDSC